jgi:hypothetical protein
VDDPSPSQDDAALYRKLGEAFHVAPWDIPTRLTLPQWYGFFAAEGPPKSHAEAVERANRIRRKLGKPPLTDKLPGTPKDG